jgi:SAM-dependent methyltransferase
MTAPTAHRDLGGEVLRLFEAKAPGWAAKYAPDGPLAHRLVALTVAVRWRARVGSQVLDLGCGTGELARALTASGLRVTGCDISPQMLRHARDRGGRVGWVRLAPHWRRLPFASGAFDAVVATSVLEYVDDPAAVLRECARVLRPGGVLLYTVPELRHPVRWAEWCVRRLAAITGERGGRPAWRRYRAYLRTSRQRHRVRWWRDVSVSAGLRPACPSRAGRSTLRLLAFRRTGPSVPQPRPAGQPGVRP